MDGNPHANRFAYFVALNNSYSHTDGDIGANTSIDDYAITDSTSRTPIATNIQTDFHARSAGATDVSTDFHTRTAMNYAIGG